MTDEMKRLKCRLEDWVEAGLLYPVQAKRILEYAGWADNARATHCSATHETLTELFDDVRRFVALHPGACVLAADNPVAGHIAWVAFQTVGNLEHSEQFSIAMHDVKRLRQAMDPSDPLRELLKSADGRRRLAEQLARVPSPVYSPS